MKIMKKVLTVAAVSALMLVSCFAGSQLKKNYVTVLDIKTGKTVSLEAPENAQIYVVSPDGFEPGVLAATSKDGSAILILPQSMIDTDEKKDDKTPAPATPQKESNRERLDHAGLIRISQ